MHQKRPVSVLVAPLDWGLGHATRCIPIVKELINQGAQVILAAGGGQKNLLLQEFPELECLEIPGYRPRYNKGIFLKWALIARVPAFLKQVRRENKWHDETLRNYKIDALISDNRYGLYHENMVCVFITHQLFIQSGFGKEGKIGGWRMAMGDWIDRKIMKWNYRFIRKFTTCWVPDEVGEFSIAGMLSHPPVQPMVPVKYIGILSRFEPMVRSLLKNSVLILISGPEPQRTEFEKTIFSQLPDLEIKAIVVRGLPGSTDPIPFVKESVRIFNHLSTETLNEYMMESSYIIARSGYSTIMDLVKLKRTAILVPTSGQTEQEYLGRYLHDKNWMCMVSENKFNLLTALREFRKREWKVPEISDTHLKITIEEFLKCSYESKNAKMCFEP